MRLTIATKTKRGSRVVFQLLLLCCPNFVFGRNRIVHYNDARHDDYQRDHRKLGKPFGVRESYIDEKKKIKPYRSSFEKKNTSIDILVETVILCKIDGTRQTTIIVDKDEARMFKDSGGAIDGRCPDDALVQFDEVPVPSPVQFEANITPVAYPACVPTIGDCIGSYQDFRSALNTTIVDNSVVALCGDSTVETLDEIEVFANGITFCCESGPLKCTMIVPPETVNVSNIVFFGNDVTIRGIAFKNGNKLNVLGGSVAIDTSGPQAGDHLVDQCSFDNGLSENAGGNLYVGGGTSIIISNCLFSGGNGTEAGGNLFIQDAIDVSLLNNQFINGEADTGGNIYMEDIANRTNLSNNIFQGGGAITGGGLYLFIPDGKVVSIDDNTFTDNIADDIGGAMVIEGFDPNIVRIEIGFNDGTGNDATLCPTIYADPDPGDAACLQFSDPTPVTAPATSPTVDTPVTAPVVETSAPVADNTPVTAPIDDTPVTSPIVDTPVTAPIDDTPVTAPIVDTPVTAPIDDTPVTSPIVDTPVTAPIDDTPVTAPIDDTPITAPIFVPVAIPTEPVPTPAVTIPTEPVPISDPVQGPTNPGSPQVIVSNFFISFETDSADGEPTETEIDTLVLRIQVYLKEQLERYFGKAKIEADLGQVTLVQETYEFNPDGKPGSIYLEFSTGTFVYTDEGEPPSLLTHVFLMHSLMDDNTIFVETIQGLGGSFTDTSDAFFGGIVS